MIAVQSPVNALHRPTHGRHPSAPVVVRPTHTPGLLSLSKPAVARPQLSQAQARTPRNSQRKTSQQQQLVADSTKKSAVKAQTPANPERPPRGRQNKPAASAKADKRSTSQSPRARRLAHQPSPPPAQIPEQPDALARPTKPLRAQSMNQVDVADSNPFLLPSTNEEQTKSKPIAYRVPPELTRPSGKLARRRQSGQFASIPTAPKAISTPRPKEKMVPLVHSEPRPTTRRVSTGPVLVTNWDSFPICDDSDDVTPPSTPIRESASVPPNRTGATWQQQAFFDDAPRTAPPSAVFGNPFEDRASTPTPAQRRRHHRRVPSEGMFAMSTDDDSSSSDASEDLKLLVGLIPKRRAQLAASMRRTPSPASPDSISGAIPGFYAGSVFQNSPSPDELPVPAFRA